MDLIIIDKLVSNVPIYLNEITDYVSTLKDDHPLFFFLNSFNTIKRTLFLINTEMIEDINPIIKLSSIDIYNFIEKNQLITHISFSDNVNRHDCSICLDDNIEYSILKCGHLFHQNCIKKWLKEKKGTCPLCKLLLFENVIREWYLDKKRNYNSK